MSTTRIAIAATLALALALATKALADDAAASRTTARAQTQDRDQVRAQVHHQLTTEGAVPEKDASALDAQVSEHAAHAGYGPAIEKAIQTALAGGCKGTCLADVVRGVNGSIDKGATPDAAATAATRQMGHAGGTRSDPQARSERHRDLMHRDAAAERVHDRTMDRGQAGSRAMGAGHR